MLHSPEWWLELSRNVIRSEIRSCEEALADTNPDTMLAGEDPTRSDGFRTDGRFTRGMFERMLAGYRTKLKELDS